MLAWLDERDRDAFAPRAPCPPDAMDVRFGRRRHVVVHDVRHMLDVESPCGDVGSHEQVGRPTAHASHDAVPLLLRHAAVQRLGAIAATGERLGELVHLGARAAEYEREGRRLDVQHASQSGHLVSARDDVPGLPDARNRPGGPSVAGDRHADRVVEVTFREVADTRRQRRGEQRRLS